MLNPIANLLNFKSDHDADVRVDLSDEEQAAADKAERIKWHRQNVRNGPVKFGRVSTGQQRRAKARWQKAEARKANRRRRRKWMADQHRIATLRGQLQTIGALPYFHADVEPSTDAQVKATTWIFRRFGERDDFGDLIMTEDAVTNAIKAAQKTYLEAIGAVTEETHVH